MSTHIERSSPVGTYWECQKCGTAAYTEDAVEDHAKRCHDAPANMLQMMSRMNQAGLVTPSGAPAVIEEEVEVPMAQPVEQDEL